MRARPQCVDFHHRLVSFLCILAALVLAGCGADTPDEGPPPGPPASVGYRLLLGLEHLDQPFPGRARMFSSHAPAAASNEDYNRYLRREGEDTYVLAEHQGPGVLTRIWMTSRAWNERGHTQPGFPASATLTVETDGQPLFTAPLNAFFGGEVYPFVRPLVGSHSSAKGFYSYVPISFAASVKVSVTHPLDAGAAFPADRFFYQINLLDLAGSSEAAGPSPVRGADGALGLSPADAQAHARALEQWTDPLAWALAQAQSARKVSVPGPLAPGANELLAADGPGRIRLLRLLAPGIPASALARLRLRAWWDGQAEPSVDVPVSVAWAVGAARRSWATLAQGAADDGSLYLALPMPFRRAARLELVYQGSAPLAVGAEVYVESGPVDAAARLLHADDAAQTLSAGQALLLADRAGAGHLVGLQLSLQLDADSDALEGDEWITADGLPSGQGTGTEDFFNAHWTFEGGTRSQPLHGLTEAGGASRTYAAFRFLVPDAVPFAGHLRFELEDGNRAARSDRYRAVCFYYLAP